MLHIALHVVVPLGIALVLYRSLWRSAFGIQLATMLVDLDHLLADPIYDPERCSIGFHPLHSAPAIVVFVGLWLLPWIVLRRAADKPANPTALRLHLVGLGLVVHMLLDGLDCWV